jgi:hypothetical protein
LATREILLIGLLALLTGCEGRAFDRTYGGQFGKAREAVRSELKDPDSAKFSNLEVCAASNAVVTGKVNAKNSFGAYVGDESFFAKGSIGQFYRNVMFDDLARECYGSSPIWKEYLASIPPDVDRYPAASGATQ